MPRVGVAGGSVRTFDIGLHAEADLRDFFCQCDVTVALTNHGLGILKKILDHISVLVDQRLARQPFPRVV
jgi:hypothetical protein